MSTSIKHLLHIKATPHTVYQAISTVEGLAGWWTKDTTGDANLNGVLEFRFGAQFTNTMKVRELRPDELVVMECIDAVPDWIGTTLTFRIDDGDGSTRLRFEHGGWSNTGDFYAQCNFSWGRYMESLRNLCESGRGNPFTI